MRRRARRTTNPVRRPLLETLEPRTLLSAVTWTGGAGDNNWDTPANWSTDSVPGSADDVTINIAADVVHSNDVTDSIHSLTSTEPLTISGGTLSIAAASTINSTLSITGGTLTGTGNLSVSGLVTLTSGTLSGSSALNANGGMLINPAGGNFNLDGRAVNNPAGQTATWTTGSIEASDGSVFNNLGTFVVDGLSLYEDSGIGAASSFNDVGTFITTANTANAGFNVLFNVPEGSVDVKNNSQLDLDEGGTVADAAFNTESSGVLDLGNYVFDTATTITGSGTLQLDNSVVLPANYAFTGATNILGFGSLQVDGSLAGGPINVGTDQGDSTLSGTGTVGPLSVADADVSPGDDGDPGVLNVQGPADFTGAFDDEFGEEPASLTVELNGPTAGTGYSQLNVNGAVQLGSTQLGTDQLGADCSLNASLGFTPSMGEQFTIVRSTAPVVGTFQGLPEGASLTIGNTPFTISYVGGDGDDVVLTAGTPAITAPPAVTGISPNSGPAAGGTAVTITGTGFTGATVVDFGTTAATGVVVVNSTTITANSPAGSGVVDVTVVTPEGTSATSAADRFTYTAAVVAAPTVTGVSPDSGPTAGGTAVTITGSGFTGATAIDFGTTAATGVVVVNSTTITANSPAGSDVVDVTVVTPEGTSAASAADRFTYTVAVVAAPTVTGVSPDNGPTAGGTTVTIAGTGFTGATAVNFGTTAATDVVVVNGTTITAVSPAGAGVADVTVITSAGASAITPADRFTYVAPPVTVVSVKRVGFHSLPTKFVLTFDSPLDAVRASDPASYQLVDMAHPLRRLGFRSATYNPANQSVTLSPFHRLYLYDHYRLTVANPQSMAVTAAGDPANGGTAGGDFVTTISPANLVLTPAQRRDGPLLARIRSLAARFPGLAHLVDGRAPRPGA